MTTILRTFIVGAAIASLLNAHWPWAGVNGKEAVISFGLFPDVKLKGRVVTRMMGGKYWSLDAKGKATPLTVTAGENFVSAPASAPAVVGIIDYGVFSGEGDPLRLVFTMKGVVDVRKVPVSGVPLPIEIVPAPKGLLKVMMNGAPAAGAEITIYEAAQGVAHRAAKKKGEIPEEAVLLKTGKDGAFALPAVKAGEYIVAANVTEQVAGTHEGAAFKKKIHMATLHFHVTD